MNRKTVFCALLSVAAFFQAEAQTTEQIAFFEGKNDTLTAYCRARQGTHRNYVGRIRLDSAVISGKRLDLYYNTVLADYPMRPDVCRDIYAILRDSLPASLSGYELRALSEGKEITELIPVFYRTEKARKKSVKSKNIPTPLVTPLDRPPGPPKGFTATISPCGRATAITTNKNSCAGNGNAPGSSRRLKTSTPRASSCHTLSPCWNGPGAVVMLPRERDWQKTEIISDNDAPTGGYREQNGKYAWDKGPGEGFAHPKAVYLDGETLYDGHLPQVKTVSRRKTRRAWPSGSRNLPTRGSYAVYVSYKTIAAERGRCHLYRPSPGRENLLPGQPANGRRHVDLPRHVRF